MKNTKLTTWILLPALLLVGTTLSAQYDDMYYNPNNHTGNNTTETYYPTPAPASSYDDSYYQEDDYSYDDQDNDYYDDSYDYQYASRIRRFHRPYYGFDYYDPVYIDAFYYDPFAFGGTTTLIYDSPWGFNRWNRFNRFNRWNRWNAFNGWNLGYNPYAFGFGPTFFGPTFGVGFGYNPWNNGFYGGGWNRWNNNFFGNNFYGGGFSNFYCPPAWGNNYTYNTVNVYNDNNTRGVIYGPRRSGSTVAARQNNRITPLQQGGGTGNPTINNRPAATNLEKQPVRTRDGGIIATDNNGRTPAATAPQENVERQPTTRTAPTPAGATRTAPAETATRTPVRIFDSAVPTRTENRPIAPPRDVRSAPAATRPEPATRTRTAPQSTRSNDNRDYPSRNYPSTSPSNRNNNGTVAPRSNNTPSRTPSTSPSRTPSRSPSTSPSRRSGGGGGGSSMDSSRSSSPSPSVSPSRSSSSSRSGGGGGGSSMGSSRSSSPSPSVSPSVSPSRSSSSPRSGGGSSTSSSSSRSSSSSGSSSRSTPSRRGGGL